MTRDNTHTVSTSRPRGHGRKPVEVTPPVFVIHFVRDLRNVLTREQLDAERDKDPNAYDKIRKEAEDEIKTFINALQKHTSDAIISLAPGQHLDSLQLEHFDTQQVMSGTSVSVIFRNHLEFFTTTFYISLSAQTDNTGLHWEDFQVVPDAVDLVDFLRPYVEYNISNYHHIIEVRVDTIEHDHKIYDDLEWLFDISETDAIYHHTSGAMLGDRETYFWTDFQHTSWNKSRILIRNKERSGARLGRLIRRLLDVCTYSSFIIDTEPHARKQLNFMRDRLRNINGLMNRAENIDSNNKESLEAIFMDLAKQASAISGQITETRSRFTASVAYWQIIKQRLSEMDEQRIASFSRLGRLLEKQVKPVADNCIMAIQCQTGMAKQVEQVAEIVRTKVDIIRRDQNSEIDKQNRKIELFARAAAFVGVGYGIIGLVMDTKFGTISVAAPGFSVPGWLLIVAFVIIVIMGVGAYWHQYNKINSLTAAPVKDENERASCRKAAKGSEER